MPKWVEAGYQEYAKRLPKHFSLELHEIPLGGRGQRQASADKESQAKQLLAKAPASSLKVALDENGKLLSTKTLAGQIERWMQSGRDVSLLIGGPDGLAPSIPQQADLVWSLSPLTLPHPLVRVVVAEQLYRAWSLLENHPYHRA